MKRYPTWIVQKVNYAKNLYPLINFLHPVLIQFPQAATHSIRSKTTNKLLPSTCFDHGSQMKISDSTLIHGKWQEIMPHSGCAATYIYRSISWHMVSTTWLRFNEACCDCNCSISTSVIWSILHTRFIYLFGFNSYCICMYSFHPVQTVTKHVTSFMTTSDNQHCKLL